MLIDQAAISCKDSRRAELAVLMAAFERKKGKIKTLPILKRGCAQVAKYGRYYSDELVKEREAKAKAKREKAAKKKAQSDKVSQKEAQSVKAAQIKIQTENRISDVTAMLKIGKTLQQIADALSCSRNTVSRLISRYKLRDKI